MATLVISDIHERLDKLANALSGRVEKASRVVFLGDWFDAFGKVDLGRVNMVCRFINGNIDGIFYEPKDNEEPGRLVPVDFLLGNHDCHYFFQHNGFKCSGYENRKQDAIDTLIPRSVMEKFHIFTRVGPYLLSHAGFHKGNMDLATPEAERHHLQIAHDGGFSKMWGAGMARGGNQALGGPTWLDWNDEFGHIDGTPQIVGHTNQRDNLPKSKGITKADSTVNAEGNLSVEMGLMSHCIDTALRHVLWLEDDGRVTIEQCN